MTCDLSCQTQTSKMLPTNWSPRAQVSVEGVSPDQYLERFAWNEAKYPPRRPLAETVSAITETTQKLEDDLKVTASSHVHMLSPYGMQCRRCVNNGCCHVCDRCA